MELTPQFRDNITHFFEGLQGTRHEDLAKSAWQKVTDASAPSEVLQILRDLGTQFASLEEGGYHRISAQLFTLIQEEEERIDRIATEALRKRPRSEEVGAEKEEYQVPSEKKAKIEGTAEHMEVESPSELPTTCLSDVLPQVLSFLKPEEKADLWQTSGEIRNVLYYSEIEPILAPLFSDSEFPSLYQLVTGDAFPSADLFKKRAEAERKGDVATVMQIPHELVNAYRNVQDLKSEWESFPSDVKNLFGNIDSSKILGNAEFCKLVLRASRAYNLHCVARIFNLQMVYPDIDPATRDGYIEAGERAAKELLQQKDGFTELKVRLSDPTPFELTRLPIEVTSFSNLRVLNLDECNGIRLPMQTQNLSMLEELSLDDTNLSKIPKWIGSLTHLTTVNLANNHITQLTSQLWELINLRALRLYHNEITQIPPDIEKLSNLEELNLCSNKIDQLPPQIGNLRKLKWIYVYQNRLTSLPPQIGQLFELITLNASKNQLTELPPAMGDLKCLGMLDVAGNQLTSLPAKLSKIKSLTFLNLEGNRLTSLPKEILEMRGLNIDDRDLTKQKHPPTENV